MPKMVKIAANPDFKATDETRDANKAAKKAPPLTVPYQTALENIRNSGGMYRILPEKAPQKVEIELDLEALSNEELKIMMLKFGVKTAKQMTKTQVISLIRGKMSSIEIVDDED